MEPEFFSKGLCALQYLNVFGENSRSSQCEEKGERIMKWKKQWSKMLSWALAMMIIVGSVPSNYLWASETEVVESVAEEAAENDAPDENDEQPDENDEEIEEAEEPENEANQDETPNVAGDSDTPVISDTPVVPDEAAGSDLIVTTVSTETGGSEPVTREPANTDTIVTESQMTEVPTVTEQVTTEAPEVEESAIVVPETSTEAIETSTEETTTEVTEETTTEETEETTTEETATETETEETTTEEEPAEISVSISGKVSYNEELKAGQFTFRIREVDETGSQLDGGFVASAKNDADGGFTFDEIVYEKAGTYYYKVSQKNGGQIVEDIKYDGAVYTVTVEVTENEDGLSAEVDKDASAIRFVNEYVEPEKEVETSVSISGKVTYDEELKAGQFSFRIREMDDQGSQLNGGFSTSAKNDADGNFTFSEIVYKEAGTYYYEVSQKNGGQTVENIKYDGAVYIVTVEVTENEDGLSAEADKDAFVIRFVNECVEPKKEEEPKKEFEYSDGRVSIKAYAPESANFPQDAELKAEYLAPGSSAYNEAVAAIESQLASQLGADKEGVVMEYVLYDIYFLSPSENMRIEPEDGHVKVEMIFHSPAEVSTEGDIVNSEVVHVKDDGQAEIVTDYINTNDRGAVTSMGFTQDSFSVTGAGLAIMPASDGAITGYTLGSGTDELNNVANVEVAVSTAGNSRDTKVNVKIDFEILNTNKNWLIENPTLTYELPEALAGFPSGEYVLRGSDGTAVGTYQVENNNLKIQFTNENWININNNIVGSIGFDCEFNRTEVADKDHIDIKFPGVAEVFGFDFDIANVGSEKTAYLNEKEGYIEYYLKVTPNKTMDLTVTDIYSGDVNDIQWNTVILKQNEPYQESSIEVTKTDTGFTYTISQAQMGVTYEIKYRVAVDKDDYDKGSVKNEVEWSWEGSTSGDKHNEVVITLQKKWVSKNVIAQKQPDGKYLFTWTVVVNGQSPKDGYSVAGKTVTDTLSGKHKYYGDIEVTGTNGWNATIQKPEGTNFSYTFPATGAVGFNGEDTFTFTYQTISDVDDVSNGAWYEVKNKATFDGQDDGGHSASSGGNYQKGEAGQDGHASITKSFDSADLDAGILHWIITVNINEGETIDDVVVQDRPIEGWNYTHKLKPESIIVTLDDENQTILSIETDYNVTENRSGGYNISFLRPLSCNAIITLDTCFDIGEINNDQGSNEYCNEAHLTYKYDGQEKSDDSTVGHEIKKEYNIKKENNGYDQISKTIEWKVMINPNSESYADGMQIVLKDVLPENTTFVDGSIRAYKYALGYKASEEITGRLDVNVSNDILTINNVGGINDPVKEEAGAVYEFFYKTKLDDDFYLDDDGNLKTGELTFKNVAELWDTAGNVYAKANASQKITPKYLEKTAKAPSSQNDAYIKYSIKVNPDEANLLPDSDYLDLEDTLAQNLNLVVSTVKVTDAEGVPIEDAGISYDSTTKKLVVHVPDEKFCNVYYEAEIIGEVGKSYSISNTIYLRQNKSIESSSSGWYQKYETSGIVHGDQDHFQIKKIDKEHLDIGLGGATFALYQVDFNSERSDLLWGKPAFICEGITSENAANLGMLTLPTGNASITADHLYYFVETEAPAGYKLDTTKYFFILKGNDYGTVQNIMSQKYPTISYMELSDLNVLFTVSNEKSENKGSLTVKKKFAGAKALTNEEKGAISFTVTGPNGYKESFTYAEMTDGEKALNNLTLGEYSVTESKAGKSGYTLETTYKVDGEENSKVELTDAALTGTVEVTNTYTFITTEVTVIKTWNDANNQNGKRPESITVNLLANDEQVDSKVVTESDNWEWTFTDLPKYSDGEEIIYTITEEAVEDYTTTVNGFNITNDYTPNITSRTVTKVWADAENQDGKRPEEISVQLLADEEPYGDEIILNTANNWEYTWTELPQKQNGTDVVYTVKEVDVPEGYTVVYSESGTSFIITNTYTPETTTISGSKIWDDEDDRDGKRPDSITVYIKDGDKTVDTIHLSAGGDKVWQDKELKFTSKELPKFRDGNEIVYTVEEAEVADYTASYDGTVITNKYVPEEETETEETETTETETTETEETETTETDETDSTETEETESTTPETESTPGSTPETESTPGSTPGTESTPETESKPETTTETVPESPVIPSAPGDSGDGSGYDGDGGTGGEHSVMGVIRGRMGQVLGAMRGVLGARVRTGDESFLFAIIYAVLMIAAIGAITVVVIKRRRKKNMK